MLNYIVVCHIQSTLSLALLQAWWPTNQPCQMYSVCTLILTMTLGDSVHVSVMTTMFMHKALLFQPVTCMSIVELVTECACLCLPGNDDKCCSHGNY